MADLDRTAYLDRVAARLHLDPETEAEVLAELRTHLDDSTRNLMLEGIEADDAERRALRNLGNPDALASGLRRAHRGSRRLLAAAGGGVYGAAEGAVRGFAAIFGAVFVAAFLGFAAAFTIVSVLPDSATILTSSGPLDSVLRLVLVVPIAFGGSRRATVVVAREARQPIPRAALAVGAIGGGLLAVVFLFVLRVQIDAGAAFVETGIVVTWLAGAASVGRIPAITMSRRTWIVVVLGIALLYAVDMIQVARAIDPTSGMPSHLEQPDLSRIGPVLGGEDGLPVVNPDFPYAEGVYSIGLDLAPDDPDAGPAPTLAGWTDLRLELWPALPIPDARRDEPWDVGELDPAFTAPIRTAPLTTTDDHLSGSIRLNDIPGLDRIRVVMTGVSPDGTRTVLHWHDERAHFSGTLFDWLTSPTPAGL